MIDLAETAQLALDTIHQKPVRGIPCTFMNLMDHAFIERIAGAGCGDYKKESARTYLAFQQAMGMARRGGTISLNGLPPGDFPLSVFDTVLNGTTVRGSIVGTRLDLQEALDFAGAGKVHATVKTDTLENINAVFDKMHKGDIEGRIVLDFENAV